MLSKVPDQVWQTGAAALVCWGIYIHHSDPIKSALMLGMMAGIIGRSIERALEDRERAKHKAIASNDPALDAIDYAITVIHHLGRAAGFLGAAVMVLSWHRALLFTLKAVL